MRPLAAAGWALAGAALASAAIYALPILTPGDHAAPEVEESAGSEGPAGNGVTLDAAAITRAGIRVITLKATSQASARTGFARALDLGPLAAINAEIASARAALSASQADLSRQQALAAQDQSASARAVDTARAQALGDKARLNLAQRRIALEYGSGLAHLDTSQLEHLVLQASNRQAALVRLDFPGDNVPQDAVVTIGGDGGGPTARVLGAAAAVDARLQSPGMLALVRGPMARSLAVGRVVPASLAGAGSVRAGVIVPRDAIVRTQGGLWVYRAEAEGRFRRVELVDAFATEGGWFVASGLRPGDHVAAGGTAVLLGIEAGPPPEED